MKNILALVFMALLSTNSYAGIGVCHDGNGKITKIERDALWTAFQEANCVYFESQ